MIKQILAYFGTYAIVLAGLALVPKVPTQTYFNTGATGPTGAIQVPVIKDKADHSVKKLEVSYQRSLFLTGEVRENALTLAKEISQLKESSKPVYLFINSPGGSVLDGAAVVSAMEASKVPIYTVCEQLCASMAAIIHQYGTKRYMQNRSILMFHDASGGASGSIPQMLNQLKMIDKYTHKMDEYIAKRSGQKPEDFEARLAAEIWLDNDDSLEQKYSDGTVAITMSGKEPIMIMGMFGENADSDSKKLLNF